MKQSVTYFTKCKIERVHNRGCLISFDYERRKVSLLGELIATSCNAYCMLKLELSECYGYRDISELKIQRFSI